MKKLILIILLFIISILSFGMTGYVTRVSDGDSFQMKSRGKNYRVRMYGIDAPELKQFYGDKSKKYLENLILKKSVKLDIITTDKYGRKVARVFVGDKEINEEMLRSGNAWFYEYYAKNMKKYQNVYLEAKENKKGLWKYKNLENPRDYRLKNKRK